jgi:hypothetical protein
MQFSNDPTPQTPGPAAWLGHNRRLQFPNAGGKQLADDHTSRRLADLAADCLLHPGPGPGIRAFRGPEDGPRGATCPAGRGHFRVFARPAHPGSRAATGAELHGISIALYNTAFGLIVAIPALIFWRYFRARVDGYLLGMELASEQFVRHLIRVGGK